MPRLKDTRPPRQRGGKVDPKFAGLNDWQVPQLDHHSTIFYNAYMDLMSVERLFDAKGRSDSNWRANYWRPFERKGDTYMSVTKAYTNSLVFRAADNERVIPSVRAFAVRPTSKHSREILRLRSEIGRINNVDEASESDRVRAMDTWWAMKYLMEDGIRPAGVMSSSFCAKDPLTKANSDMSKTVVMAKAICFPLVAGKPGEKIHSGTSLKWSLASPSDVGKIETWGVPLNSRKECVNRFEPALVPVRRYQSCSDGNTLYMPACKFLQQLGRDLNIEESMESGIPLPGVGQRREVFSTMFEIVALIMKHATGADGEEVTGEKAAKIVAGMFQNRQKESDFPYANVGAENDRHEMAVLMSKMTLLMREISRPEDEKTVATVIDGFSSGVPQQTRVMFDITSCES